MDESLNLGQIHQHGGFRILILCSINSFCFLCIVNTIVTKYIYIRDKTVGVTTSLCGACRFMDKYIIFRYMYSLQILQNVLLSSKQCHTLSVTPISCVTIYRAVQIQWISLHEIQRNAESGGQSTFRLDGDGMWMYTFF